MRYPFIYTASATGIGGRWEGSYGHLIQNMKAGGIPTLFIMHRYTTKRQVADIRAAGIDVWAWDEPGHISNDAFVDYGYDGLCLQTEFPDQRDGALRELQGGLGAGKEKHIITYYFGFDDGYGAAHWLDFKAAGVTKMQVEAYAADGHTDTKAYVDYGAHLIKDPPAILPVLGVYRGEFPANYANIDTVGTEFGCYIVDNWPDATTNDPELTYWKTWGGLNKTVALLQYWKIIGNKTDAKLFETRANTDATGSGLDRVETWINNHEQKIRDEEGFRLVKVQH